MSKDFDLLPAPVLESFPPWGERLQVVYFPYFRFNGYIFKEVNYKFYDL